VWQRGGKHYQRFYEGKLHQTMVDSWCCLDQVGLERRSQVSRRSEVGKHKRRVVFDGLCCQMSILCAFWHYVYGKTFSFEYREIPGLYALWRCPLYNSTIFKSWIQLFALSIFELPNKSTPFRMSHFASEKLLNVYVLHSLDKQWLSEFVQLITVLNDPKKRCVSWRIFICKQKIKSIHNFFGDNTILTHGPNVSWHKSTKTISPG